MKKAIVPMAIAALAVALCLCLVGCGESGSSKVSIPKNVKVGDVVTFGTYEQDNNTSNGKEDIEWRVLAVENGKALFVSEKGLDCQQFNHLENMGNDWDKSELKAWLQGEFAEAAGLTEYKSSLTILSADEAVRYFKNDEDRMCAATPYAEAQGVDQRNWAGLNGIQSCYWWLRTPGRWDENATSVEPYGSIIDYGYVDGSGCAVRPALWVDL